VRSGPRYFRRSRFFAYSICLRAFASILVKAGERVKRYSQSRKLVRVYQRAQPQARARVNMGEIRIDKGIATRLQLFGAGFLLRGEGEE